MSRILFATWDGGGNVAPAVEIARELQRDGHGVRFLGQERQRSALEGAGFEFSAYRRPGPWTASGRRGPIKNAVGFLTLLTSRGLGRDLIAEADRAETDLVVIDCLLFGAIDVVARAGRRHAVLVHSLYEAIDTTMAHGAPGAIARLRGLRAEKLWAGSDLLIGATLTQLDRGTAHGVPGNLRYTGPAIPQVARREAPRGEVSILVSLSTTYLPTQAAVLQNILDALADLPVKVIVTTGPAVDPAALRPAPNSEVHEYLRHADIMPRAALVIGHGGHATTMLALANDLPLLILPMNPAFDQKLIGEAIQRAGAGTTMAATSAPAEIAAAVVALLGDDIVKVAAARLGAAIRASHGARAASEMLAELAASDGG